MKADIAKREALRAFAAHVQRLEASIIESGLVRRQCPSPPNRVGTRSGSSQVSDMELGECGLVEAAIANAQLTPAKRARMYELIETVLVELEARAPIRA